MIAYIIRRLLLMIPLLFGISLLNFGIVNAAPAPRSSNVQASGDFDASKGMEANEAEFIFRRTFNLDKPTFFNTRFWLTDEDILWRLATPTRAWAVPAEKRAAQNELDDFGRTIVPHLLRLATAARDGELGTLRADYESRWRDSRPGWVKAGRPPGDVAWPPPNDPPPFDGEFAARMLTLALGRLAANAPRRPDVVYGEEITDAIIARNEAIRIEQVALQRIFRGDGTEEEKLAQWTAWYDEHRAEWDYSTGDKIRTFFLDTRFAKFWGNLLHLDLGTSFIHRQKVWTLIADRIHVSLTLSLGSMLIAYFLAIPLGIFSAVKHGSVADHVISVLLFALYALPSMFLGVLLVKYLSVQFGWFPVAGFNSTDYADSTVLGKIRDRGWHVTLPLVTLTIGQLAYLSRYMKSGLIETLRADYIRTAHAKGLSSFVVVWKHAVRNGMIPIITLLGASLPVLIGGSIVVEFIFQIDGMGWLAFSAVKQRDYAVILGLNMVAAVLTMIGVFLSDIAYAVVDPRISYK